ncbi:MAG: PPC domain-containing protein [Planctomycetaceae bacterium]|nr:PPC domain-containing protein [Planctomycetaceae bacterium]
MGAVKRSSSTLTICLTLCLGSLSFAQAPRIERVEKAGGQRGTDFEVQFSGERLGGVEDVILYDEGLSLVKAVSDDDTSVTVTLHADSQCQPGEYPLRLQTPAGVSDLCTIHVSPYRQRSESEPNNTPAAATPIDPGVTIHGLIEEGDVDLYRVTLKQGDRLSAEVVGIRNTRYVFDARIAVLDADGNELTANDDSVLLRQDPMLSFLAPKDGDYLLAIREAAFGGDLDSIYQLHIGSHPRPVVCYPAGGMPGAEETISLIGDAAGPIVQTTSLPASIGTVELFPEDKSGIAPTPVRLRVSPFPNSLEQEPNNTPDSATASVVGLPVALNGILQKRGDLDVFRFRAEAGQPYNVSVFGERIGSPIDTVVSISTPDGSVLVTNDDGANHDSEFRFSAPATGEYLITVRDHLQNGGPDYVYRVEFQPVEASLQLRVPVLSESRQQQRQKVEVCRGGRTAIVVSARRRNFFGAIDIQPDFLPEGVTAKASRIPGSSHLGYILFEAAEDAPLTGGLFGINGVGTSQSDSVHGRLSQETGLAFGPPRRTVYHSINVDQLPITVLESGPFTLDVKQPAVPIPKDGQLDLTVVANRNGYEDDIKLTLPVLPPWIEVPENGVIIPEGESQTTFTLTATDLADTADWTVLMMGEGNMDGEEVFASSGEFSFDVVAPYLSVTIDKSIAQQGGRGRVVCKANWSKADATQPAVARLRGLPKFVDVAPVAVPIGSNSFAFDIAVGKETPASIHNTLYVEVEVPQSGSVVRHFSGRGGVLEVLAEGQKPRDDRSRLEILRSLANRPQPASDSRIND